MRYVKWTFVTLVVLFVGGFFHYVLPQHDIVRIVNTYEERQDLTGWTTMFWQAPDNGSTTNQTRDVQFIQAVYPNGKSMVYRNEDTGWGWPPYFKFDTANLYTEANDAISTKAAPEWYSVTHYGWRNEILSIFPNAIAFKAVEGPDVRIIPWFNIVFLIFFATVLLLIRRMWLQFRERTIDPLVEDVDEAWDDATERTRDTARGIKGWFSKKR
ncbi:DUF1523 family protein [Celeribacter sp.]|uniref:DUF1523 family protein n=1 Tax=Celeribacter sp. TaxID=1890673 RepID=UPI003A8F7D47